MGRIAQKRGDLERATRLYGGAAALRDDLGISLHPADRELYDRAMGELREAQPSARFEAEWARGGTLTVAELVREATASGVPTARA